MDAKDFGFQADDFLPNRTTEEIDLVDEKGNSYQWEVFYSFSLLGNDYLVFIPSTEQEYQFVNVEMDDPDSDVPGYIVMRLGQDEAGEEILEEILDIDELEEIREFVEDEIGLVGQFLNREE
ncbi:hypothetical protein LEP1GSC202_2277 [Leptospira yanagawae serovar Saopaulo str. Sao Paulo = ATCC 700523]|uniref:DUF1292 domain-containing protein n=2 Tax=Leptospira yanagawae TaxID=293069 RepID=A0ABY2M1K2_9LEPT|nr:DUF1292 domain-containing protein [Leptospira yanagawae]EOQ88519.1 hypothetical protein LEP1GSC202_2277 [Leptospira yanagawae serovar Saopaulo str. Sao Paulo = ATCC 700523]TGL21094.1 DUF1292 domain-containing protein [Leptospira yanagawae]